MTRTGASAWYIDSRAPSGKHTSLTAKGLGSRLDTQPWAYVTMECYGCTGCNTLPPGNSSSDFQGMALSAGGKPLAPVWLANPKPARDRTCPSSIDILSATSVNIYPGTK
jgi:hypothetical protein